MWYLCLTVNIRGPYNYSLHTMYTFGSVKVWSASIQPHTHMYSLSLSFYLSLSLSHTHAHTHAHTHTHTHTCLLYTSDAADE